MDLESSYIALYKCEFAIANKEDINSLLVQCLRPQMSGQSDRDHPTPHTSAPSHRHSSTMSRLSDRTSPPPNSTPSQRNTTSRGKSHGVYTNRDNHSHPSGLSFLSSLMGTLRRSHPRQESPPPPPEDLGLKTLRQV